MSAQDARYGTESSRRVDHAVVRLAEADRALAAAIDVASSVPLVAQGKLLVEWARAVHAGEAHQRQAQVFVLRAMRNAGQRIAEAQERGEVATAGLPPSQRDVGASDIPATLSDLGVTRDESSDWQRLADSYSDAELTETAEEMDRPSLTGVLTRPHIANNSGESEWYTPREYITAAREAMGGIDLDPASTAVANTVVDATTFYSREDSGLGRPWTGRVWMNPPYSQPLVADFCRHLVEEYVAGRVEAACVLVNNATETDWFQGLAVASAACCFPDGRVRFWHPNRVAAPLQGQSVLYLGPDAAGFRSAFADFGFTAQI